MLRKRLAIEGDLDAADASGGLAEPRLGRGSDRGGEALPGAHGIAPDRHRRRRDPRRRSTFPPSARYAAARRQRAAARRRQLFLRRRATSSSICPRPRSRRSRTGASSHRYVAIVGDVEHPSPEISAHISVDQPQSDLDRADLDHQERDHPEDAEGSGLSRAREDPHPRRFGGRGRPQERSTGRASGRPITSLRQDSGAGNSLGAIRIGMPNKLAVYMHDTPSKRLFGADYRFLSHGCVRVQGVYDFAEWLLQGASGGPQGVWDKAALPAEVKAGAREDIRLARPVPVIWVYLTGWSNQDGAANFRDDVYGVDAAARRRRARGDAAARSALSRCRTPRRRNERAARCKIASIPTASSSRRRARGALMGNRGGRFHRADRTLGPPPLGLASNGSPACARSRAGGGRSGATATPSCSSWTKPTALAAGHRPCFECRRAEAEAFRSAFGDGARLERVEHRRRPPPRAARTRAPSACGT